MEITGAGGSSWVNPNRTKEDRQNMPGNIASLLGASAAIDTSVKKDAEKTKPDAVQEFKDYMAKTPEQRMQEAWLESRGITKEEFDAMTPDEKQSLMDMMRKEIDEKVRAEAMNSGKKQLDIFV